MTSYKGDKIINAISSLFVFCSIPLNLSPSFSPTGTRKEQNGVVPDSL
jgi:hypothetical protein